MKTVFREILDLSRQAPSEGLRFGAVTLMVSAMDQKPAATLPADDVSLASILGLPEQKWESIKARLLDPVFGWEQVGDRWVNRYLKALTEKQRAPKPANPKPSASKITFNAATAKFDGITDKRRAAWQTLHPTADLDIMLAGCANWLLDHPADLAKTRDFSKRITNWIKRERVRNPAPQLKDPVKESGEHFMAFWGAYHPSRRINFTRAASTWKALDLDREVEAVMAGLQRWINSRDWHEKNGEFVPSPDKWLLAKRWLDSPAPYQQTAILRDRAGRVVGHDRSMKDLDHGKAGAIRAR